jgi:ribosomal subunit interface protein
MSIQPVEIVFDNMNPSPAIESKIRERAEKLDQFFDQIMTCRVLVEAPHKHHHKGNLYRIRINLTVPGEELVVSRVPDDQQAHEDVYVAIRDAFDAIRRQLEDYAARRHGQVKRHSAPQPGGAAG